MLSCAHTGNLTPKLDIATNLTAYRLFRACREWVFYQLGGGRDNTRSRATAACPCIVEDEARKDDEARRDPDRRGTEMAHEFAIERWDAAAVFLTTRVVLPQMLDIGIT